MKNIVTKILALALLVVFSMNPSFADDDPPPSKSSKNGNFKKSEFSSKSKWSNDGKGTGLPDPNSGNAHQGPVLTAPIPGGLAFLVVGSILFLAKRIREDED